METKHTKGPWRRVRGMVHAPGTRPIVTLDCEDYIFGAGNAETPEEREANAQLISTAPELLEALDALMRCFGPAGDLQINVARAQFKPVDRTKDAVTIIDAARDALAKARGE